MPELTLDDVEIDIDVRNNAWGAVLDLRSLTRNALAAATEQYCTRSFTEISLLFTGNAQIQELNRTYRGKDTPTNVLSFPTDASLGIPVLGDIVLAFEVIKGEAQDGGIALEDHVTHLLIHGYFHLQGLDHDTDEDAEIMESHEINALAGLGITNPYDKDKS